MKINEIAKNIGNYLNTLIVVGSNPNKSSKADPRWSIRLTDDFGRAPMFAVAISEARAVHDPSDIQYAAAGHPVPIASLDMSEGFEEVHFVPERGVWVTLGNVVHQGFKYLVYTSDGKQMACP